MVVADTHAFLWFVFGMRQLSREAARTLAREQKRGGIVISDRTPIELSGLALKGKVDIPDPFASWLRDALASTRAVLRPVDVDIAARAHALGGALHDPDDRVITATALELGCALVTCDEAITSAKVVKTIW